MNQIRSAAFPHQRLEAYRLALELAAEARQLCATIPRGYRHIADHLQRAADDAVLLLAEGANRWGNGEKRQRFIESRGECGEAAAAADLVGVHGFAPQAMVAGFQQRENRLAAMITGLVHRCS